MPIPLTCTCGRSMRIKDDLAGKRIRCPGCSLVLTVPKLEVAKDEEDEALDVLLTPSPDQEARRPSPAYRAPPEEERPTERAPYRPPPKLDPRPKEMKRVKERRRPRVTFGEGWFGSMDAGMIGGILMMLIAAIWFFAGLAGGVIFFYPPILFVIGLAALLKGVFSRG